MSTSEVAGLQCMLCGRVFGADTETSCPKCGPEGRLDVRYEYRRVRESLSARPAFKRPAGFWRYPELLPVNRSDSVSGLALGGTPLLEVPRLAVFTGLRGLRIKDEGRNPSGSIKDRLSAVAVMRASEKGLHTVAAAGTARAACSLAVLAVSAGLRACVFLSAKASGSAAVHCQLHGAQVLRVNANPEGIRELCDRASAEWGWYNGSAGAAPHTVEGIKTAGHEIAEAVQDDAPEWVAVPVGNGGAIAAIWKGMQEMHHLGVLPRRPRMLGVQAEAAAPIAKAYRSGRELEPDAGETAAAEIGIGRPVEWRRAIRAVRESGGTFVCVSEGEIMEAVWNVARLAGVAVDGAGAAAVAGIRRAADERIMTPRERAVAVVGAAGPGNLEFLKEHLEPIPVIEPDLGKIELELTRRRAHRG